MHMHFGRRLPMAHALKPCHTLRVILAYGAHMLYVCMRMHQGLMGARCLSWGCPAFPADATMEAGWRQK
jgi:hypothetical protein